MRIGVYFSPWARTAHPTGVGRHVVEMTAGLAARPDVEVLRMTTQDDQERSTGAIAESLQEMKVQILPGTERASRMRYLSLRWDGVDADEPAMDWVYCPKEQPVATRCAKLAVTVHDVIAFEKSDTRLGSRQSWRDRLRWMHAIRCIRRADLIATVSEYTKQRLVDLCRVDAERVTCIGNGVSHVYFRTPAPHDHEVLSRYGVASGEYFVAVGSLTYRKGGDLLIEVAEQLSSTGPATPLLLAGRRHDADLLHHYEQVRQGNPRLPLRLLGYVSDEDLSVLMSHATALVFPSRYEGFGIPVLEAMAAGTPVICSSEAALPEIAGPDACYVDTLDKDHILQQMVQLHESSETRRTLIDAGRRRAQGYRWDACVNRLIVAMRDRT